MLETVKLYIHKQIPLNEAVSIFTALGYRRQEAVSEEGDFSVKGDTLEIFPPSYSYPVRIEWEYETIIKIYSFDKNIHKKLISYDLIIILPFKRRKTSRRYKEDIPLNMVFNLQVGDYVVHSNYGIGIFKGCKKLLVKGKEDFFWEIEYADGDRIFISQEDAHLLQKYVNFSSHKPRLTKLGSKEWLNIKQRVEKGVRNFAWELLSLEAKRRLIGGFAYSPDTEWQKVFEQSFPYKETEDQIKAIAEVKKDMEQKRCMDRLICGDVGYGKSEVAFRAAFKAVMDGKQVAFLVPTTILAYQHHLTLTKRLEPFPIKTAMLSRFCTRREQLNIIKDLADGKVDIVIGTHRLLSCDVAFRDLGLLIIDEEQRFGVKHKEYLKKLKMGIDVLMLTATPIPRTLYMSLIGVKNISIIRTPPRQRLAVKTQIIEFSMPKLKQIILNEINRGGQVFFIHNRIDTIYQIEKKLKKVLPETIKLSTIHGQMPSRVIEDTMRLFIEGKIHCLLSTAIVESGIDIPKANTIIINQAHLFGLSDLHQLRGRVGREKVQGYAYLVVPNLSNLAQEVKRRLKLVEEYSYLGAGFEIAMSDLELRGAGNILGPQQHGFVWMVGFDMYCRLLKKEIEYLQFLLEQTEEKERSK